MNDDPTQALSPDSGRALSPKAPSTTPSTDLAIAPSHNLDIPPAPPLVTFTISDADLPAFARLPETVRADVRRKLVALQSIATAPKVLPACKAQAALMQHARGFSASTLRAQYYAYLKSGGDWRLLIDHARAGANFKPAGSDQAQHQDLPPNFVEFWRGLCERNQRKSRAARRELLRIWRTHHDSRGKLHKAIPGYDQVWPAADPATGYPIGWSESNLYRCAPTKFELTAARIGRAAAAEFRPKVFTTRVGLRVGQYIVFDDQEYDVKVNLVSAEGQCNSRAMRPLGLNSLDLFSACLFDYAFKPTIWNQETEAKQKLKEIDMHWFVVDVLSQHGFRDDETGTTLLVEHGTAAIREDFEQRIFDATHGRVRVERSGIQGRASFDGLFEGASRGNYRFKAALESIFNLVRNEMAALPGNVGLDRTHCPEEIHGRDRYNNSLIRAAIALPPERAQLLRLPFLDWSQFTGLAIEIYNRINTRIHHDLEGWVRAGLVASEWRVNEATPWLHQERFLELPPTEQAVMRSLIEARPSLTRSRKLSPLEVWHRGRPELQRIRPFLLPLLLGSEFGVERPVSKDHLFEWADQSVSPDPIRFLARLETGAMLTPGQKYLTYLNQFSPADLVICDAKGAFLGLCHPWTTATRSDVESVHRQMGAARHIESELLAPVARRGSDLARERLEMHRHNTAILEESFPGRALSPKAPSSGESRIAGSLNDYLTEDP